MKKKSFWFHYNKPYSKQFGVDKWTVHYNGQCLIVDSIKCYVYTFSRSRKTQPRVVMHGKAKSVEVVDDCAIIK
jgi:hypothetical protein